MVLSRINHLNITSSPPLLSTVVHSSAPAYPCSQIPRWHGQFIFCVHSRRADLGLKQSGLQLSHDKGLSFTQSVEAVEDTRRDTIPSIPPAKRQIFGNYNIYWEPDVRGGQCATYKPHVLNGGDQDCQFNLTYKDDYDKPLHTESFTASKGSTEVSEPLLENWRVAL
ncbi:hypothetical protein COOONC_18538 [Cooperia oncophora]